MHCDVIFLASFTPWHHGLNCREICQKYLIWGIKWDIILQGKRKLSWNISIIWVWVENVKRVNPGPFLIFQSDLNIVASYDRRGKHIYTGNAKGRVRDRTVGKMFSKKWQNNFLFFLAFLTVLKNDIFNIFFNYNNFLLFISLEISILQSMINSNRNFYVVLKYQYVLYIYFAVHMSFLF